MKFCTFLSIYFVFIQIAKKLQGWSILSAISVLSLFCDKYETEIFFYCAITVRLKFFFLANDIWKLIRQVDAVFHALQNGICVIIFECAVLSQADLVLAWTYDILDFHLFLEWNRIEKTNGDINHFMIKNCFKMRSIDWCGFQKNSYSPNFYIRRILKNDRFSEHFSTFLISNHILISLL